MLEGRFAPGAVTTEATAPAEELDLFDAPNAKSDSRPSEKEVLTFKCSVVAKCNPPGPAGELLIEEASINVNLPAGFLFYEKFLNILPDPQSPPCLNLK
jgi:hypothetical protein